MSEYSRALGDTVRAARKKMGLSQNKVAALIDADERTIMNIETYNANTTMDVLYPLIRILRIDPRDIFNPEIAKESLEHYQLRTLIDGCSKEEAATLFSVCQIVLSAVTLTNKTLPAVILPRLNEQQREIYTVMQQLKGNKPYLWEGIYNGGEDTGPSYEIPGEALDDPAFAALMEEATKYIGWPYVWGGSSPSTSFDCSGFVCWVYTASGVHNLPRTTAQGIYNQCAIISPSEAKPGDIIFFTGTYDSPGPVSHVGIYVGGGMMLHCGSPIQYANINSSYWQTHFYAFGRL